MKPFKTRALAVLTALLLLVWTIPQSAKALIKLDSDSINDAIKYGLQNEDAGLYELLGPNWIEGKDGALLNVYSPFMLIATMAAKKGLPSDTGDANVKEARRRLVRIISRLEDPHDPLKIKFAVSFLGPTPDFASHYAARIEGVGRGRTAEVKPVTNYLEKQAADAGTGGLFQAVNSYYFNYDDLVNFEEYDLILENPEGKQVIFHVKNSEIY